MHAGFERLLRPKSIAVVGGGEWCRAVIEQNIAMGYNGTIWPVHPTRDAIAGVTAYPDVGALPGAPDASFIGVNRHATIDTIQALSERGAGGAVCFASGFRETEDGAGLQTDLLAAAGEMTLLGPNCYGFVNYLDGALLWPDQHGGQRVDRGVAIVTQSSNIAINLTMQRRAVPLAYVVTAGNQAQTGLAEIGAALLEDERVTALGLHIEGVDDIRAFEALARTGLTLKKPIVVLKVGTSDKARAAALTHTASLAGSEAGASALFHRLGMGEVHTLTGFLETLKLLHVTGALPSTRIASMSCSGGEAALIADSGLRHGLDFPAISAAQEGTLRAILGPLVTPSNPLDYHTQIWRNEEALTRSIVTMIEGQQDLTMLIVDFPRADRCSATDWDHVVAGVLAARRTTQGHLAVVASLPENMPEAVAETLLAGGIAPLCGLDEACMAIRCAAASTGVRDKQPVLAVSGSGKPNTLNEAEAKTELARFGIEVPKSIRCKDAAGAVSAAGEIGFPVVLKGEGFAHKSENGAVMLELDSAEAVDAAVSKMPAPGYLVEQQVTGATVELLVGIIRDDAHGFVLTIGAGGALAEVLQDRCSLLVPSSKESVARAIDGLRVARLMQGYRGQPAIAIDAVLDAIMALQDYAHSFAERLHEVEINPLLCGADFAIAADALISRKADHD